VRKNSAVSARAGGDDQVGQFDRILEGIDDDGPIVGDGDVLDRHDAAPRQPGAEPGGVGVDRLAQRQFVADGKDDRFHG